MWGGVGYKSIKDSVSSTARSWSTILDELYSTFNELSEKERENTIIRLENSYVFHYMTPNRYTTIYRQTNGDITAIALDFGDKKAYISTNGSAFSEHTITTARKVSIEKLTLL